MEGCYSKSYQNDMPCRFAYKLVCVHEEFTKPIFVLRGENAAYEFIKAILKEYQYCIKSNEKNISTKIWSWVKKKSNSNQVTHIGYVKTHW